MEAMERWVRLSTGWVELGFKLTRTQPDWIECTENGLANYWMFELNLMARVVSWVGWSHQVISGLKHSNKENIEKSKPRPKEHRNQNPDLRFHVPPFCVFSLSLKSLTLAPLLTIAIIKLVVLPLSLTRSHHCTRRPRLSLAQTPLSWNLLWSAICGFDFVHLMVGQSKFKKKKKKFILILWWMWWWSGGGAGVVFSLSSFQSHRSGVCGLICAIWFLQVWIVVSVLRVLIYLCVLWVDFSFWNWMGETHYFSF